MYNKKSKTSAILVIITAVLLVGFMVLLPFLQYQAEEGEGIGAAFVVLIGIIFGYAPIYAGAVPFIIVAVIFGIKMLKQQSRKKLISFNVRMLITTCVLLPLLLIGTIVSGDLIVKSQLGLFPLVYTIVVALAYIVGLVTQIATIVILKKSPEESEPTVTEQSSN